MITKASEENRFAEEDDPVTERARR